MEYRIVGKHLLYSYCVLLAKLCKSVLESDMKRIWNGDLGCNPHLCIERLRFKRRAAHQAYPACRWQSWASRPGLCTLSPVLSVYNFGTVKRLRVIWSLKRKNLSFYRWKNKFTKFGVAYWLKTRKSQNRIPAYFFWFSAQCPLSYPHGIFSCFGGVTGLEMGEAQAPNMRNSKEWRTTAFLHQSHDLPKAGPIWVLTLQWTVLGQWLNSLNLGVLHNIGIILTLPLKVVMNMKCNSLCLALCLVCRMGSANLSSHTFAYPLPT